MQVSAPNHAYGPQSFQGRPSADTPLAPPSGPDQVLTHGARPAAVTGQSRLGAALVDPAVVALAEDAADAKNGHGAVVLREFIETDTGWTRTHSVTLPNGKTLSWEKTVDTLAHSLTITRSRIDADGNGTERERLVVKDADGPGATVTRNFGAIVPPPPADSPMDEEATTDPALDEPTPAETTAGVPPDEPVFEETVV